MVSPPSGGLDGALKSQRKRQQDQIYVYVLIIVFLLIYVSTERRKS